MNSHGCGRSRTGSISTRALVIDPGLDQVLGEDPTGLQVVLVGLERLHGLLERRGDLADLGQLVRGHVEEVLVHRRGRLDLVGHTVEPRHEDGREGEVGVAARVRAAELDPLGLRARRVDGDAAGGGAVPLGVDQVDRRLEAGHQPLVGVRGGRGKGQHRAGVLDDAADVPAADVGQVGVGALLVEQGLAAVPERRVDVHARSVVVEERLGHEGGGQAGLVATLFTTYL